MTTTEIPPRESSISVKAQELIQLLPDVFLYIETGREAIDEIPDEMIFNVAWRPEPIFLLLNTTDVTTFLNHVRGFCQLLTQKTRRRYTLRIGGIATTDPTRLIELLERGVKLAEEFVTILSQGTVGTSMECPILFQRKKDENFFNYLRDLRKNHPLVKEDGSEDEELIKTVNDQIKELLKYIGCPTCKQRMMGIKEGVLARCKSCGNTVETTKLKTEGRFQEIDRYYLEEIYSGSAVDIQMIQVLELITNKKYLMYAPQSELLEREYYGFIASLKELLHEIYYYFLDGY